MARLAIVGSGPAGLMVFNRLVALAQKHTEVDIFEASSTVGSGMPYSSAGALKEHVTNVSADELPELSKMLDAWILQLPTETLEEFDIDRDKFHEKKVVPRLLFGRYLAAQFDTLRKQAEEVEIKVTLHLNARILDVVDCPEKGEAFLITADDRKMHFDYVILCTGHQWEKKYEGIVNGYFDSPYPPSNLAKKFDHKVVVRGSSLTAIDAIKTIAKNNGKFYWENDCYMFQRNEDSPNFLIEMHSRDGLLPSVRVHMEEPHVDAKSLVSEDKIAENMSKNDGFLKLDFLF
ncbi:MAG: FAD/NAD(P)-binding protein [Candidatus Melainabacteria bacterium]|nr:FAD/NAD(P)-binding protein [Candidatus Melainabacteria bacterium]